MIEVLLLVFAGLGFFFLGVKQLGKNLRALSDGPLRTAVGKITSHPVVAGFWGLIFGLMTQSGRTTSLILSSFVQGGILQPKAAFPTMIWSNLGCTLIVFVTIVRIDLVVLFLIGCSALVVAFNKPEKWVRYAGAVLGAAFLLFGLQTVTHAAADLTHFAWFEQFLTYTNDSFLLAIVLGFAATIIAQSHMGIILITLALSLNGFFQLEHAYLIVLGTLLGSSAITYLTSFQIKGSARQIILGQINFNTVAVALFLILFCLEHYLHMPIFLHWIEYFFSSITVQLVVATLIINIVSASLLSFLLKPYFRMCQALSPASLFESLEKTQYVSEEMLDTPSAAIWIIEKEHLRLWERMPLYLDSLRFDSNDTPSFSLSLHHEAFQSIARQITHFQTRLAAYQLSEEEIEVLLNQRNRQELLNALEDSIQILCRTIGKMRKNNSLSSFIQNMIEALDAQILTALSVLQDKDQDEMEFLLQITSDHDSPMEKIRRDYIRRSDSFSQQDKMDLLDSTRLFERASWQLNRYAQFLLTDNAPIAE